MEDKIDQAIVNVLTMIRANSKADEALKFSQAFVNLSHGKMNLQGTRVTKPK